MPSYRPRAGKRPSARQHAPGPTIDHAADRGLPFPEMTLEGIQRALAQAGAIVSVETLASWTVLQREDARDWAHWQMKANANADPGRHVSVHWPDHVSAAHWDGMKPYATIDIPPLPEPDEVRALLKRPRRNAQTARVKQAADRKTRRRRG